MTVLSIKLRAKLPETTVIAGGPHVKVYGENVLAQNEFDLAIMGPGEEILEELLRLRKSVASKAEFPNGGWCSGGIWRAQLTPRVIQVVGCRLAAIVVKAVFFNTECSWRL